MYNSKIVYMILVGIEASMYSNRFDGTFLEALKISVDLTFAYRKTHILKNAASDIVCQINNNDEIKSRWNRYQKKNPYAKDISFESVIIEIKRLVELVL